MPGTDYINRRTRRKVDAHGTLWLWPRAGLVERVAALELDNYRASRRAELLEEELKAARARLRHLIRRVAGPQPNVSDPESG